jgi:quinol monooxygenase YgiN
MIVIRVQADIDPEKRDIFLEQVRRDIVVSRNHSGCHLFTWCEDVSHKNRFLLYEEWDSEEAFDAYKRSEHFERVNAALRPFLSSPPESSYYTASLLA